MNFKNTSTLVVLFILLFIGTAILYEQDYLARSEPEVDEIGEVPEESPEITPEPTPSPKPFPKLSKDYFRDFTITKHPKLSGRIAFSVKIGSYERILLLDLDANVIRILIDGRGNNNYPAWSPDGSRLAFTSDRDGNKEIYFSEWDGQNPERLTYSPGIDDNAVWASDGTNVIYYSEEKGSTSGRHTNIFRVNIEDRVPERLTNFEKRNSVPDISADGTSVTYSTNRFWPGWDVCSFNIYSRSEKCLLTGISSFCRARWSPDGKKLAYSSGSLKDIDIAIYDSDSGSQRVVTRMKLREYDVDWSADGKHLVFAAENGSPDDFNIYVQEIATRKVSPLVKSPYSMRYLSWTDAKTIELVAKRIKQREKEEEERKKALKELLETPDIDVFDPSKVKEIEVIGPQGSAVESQVNK